MKQTTRKFSTIAAALMGLALLAGGGAVLADGTSSSSAETSSSSVVVETTPSSETTTPATAEKGSVLAHYVDEKGNKIADDEIVVAEQEVGTAFRISPKALDGYVSPDSAVIEGTIEKGTQEITLRYTKKADTKKEATSAKAETGTKTLPKTSAAPGN